MLKKQKILLIIAIIALLAGNPIACKASTWENNIVNISAKERNLTSLVNKNPSDVNASLQLIKFYLDNNQETKAIIEANRIKNAANNNPKFFILAADLFLKSKNLDKAEQMAKNAIKVSYNSPEAFIVLGNIYYEKAMELENTQENLDIKKSYLTKSFDNFYTAYKYNPSSPFPYIGLANAYFINGQTALAQDEIRKAKELSSNNAEAIYLIGEYYYKSKDFSKAKTYLEKSINSGLTSRHKIYFMLGTIYEQENKIENAQKSYLQALKLKPDSAESQQNLDRLIKATYNEVETISKTKKNTVDLFNNINDELNTVMQADYFLAIDEFTRAREMYLKVLDKNPGNINAITGIAELYYAKWAEGFQNSADFINDSKYVLKAKETTRIVIPLTKFKMINEESMPEAVRQKLINLSVSETFDYYDLLNEVRSEFLLSNFEESHEKLQKLLTLNLSNFEKFKVLKSLCYDHNYDEALILMQDLKKTYYHNDELTPIINRINTKFTVADEKINQAITLYSKQNDFSNAEQIITQALRYFPTYKKGYLHYAYLLEKHKNYKAAIEKAHTYYRLVKLYPDKNAELSEADVKKLIRTLNQKYAESEAKK